MARKAKYTLTAGTKINVSAGAVTSIDDTVSEWLKISTTAKEVSFTGGQKQDIDVTVIESEEQENVNGLRAQSEVSLSGNWKPEDEGQSSLRAADDDDSMRLVEIEFKTGSKVLLLVEVRQESWSLAPNGVATGSFSLRVVGRPVHTPASSGGGGGGGGGEQGGGD